MKFELFMIEVSDLRLEELKSRNEFVEMTQYIVYREHEHAISCMLSLVDNLIELRRSRRDQPNNISLLSLTRKIYILHAFFTQYAKTHATSLEECNRFANFVDYSIAYLTRSSPLIKSLTCIFREIFNRGDMSGEFDHFHAINRELRVIHKPFIAIFLLSKMAILLEPTQSGNDNGDGNICFIRDEKIEDALKYFPEFDITRLSLQQRFDIIHIYHSCLHSQISEMTITNAAARGQPVANEAIAKNKPYSLFNQRIMFKFLNVYSGDYLLRCCKAEEDHYERLTTSPIPSFDIVFKNNKAVYNPKTPIYKKKYYIRESISSQIRFPEYITYKEHHIRFILQYLVPIVNTMIVIALFNQDKPKQSEFITAAALLVFGPEKEFVKGGGATCEMRMMEQIYNRVVDMLYFKTEGKRKNELIRDYIRRLKKKFSLGLDGYPMKGSDNRAVKETKKRSRDDDHLDELELDFDMDLFDGYFEHHFPITTTNTNTYI